jgi:hypothetical protein
LFLFDLLDWQHAGGLFYELDEMDWFVKWKLKRLELELIATY